MAADPELTSDSSLMSGPPEGTLRIVVLTAHVMAKSGRKTSVHFVAGEWAKLGHHVHFCTVGLSRVSRLTKPARFLALPGEQHNRFVEQQPRLHAGAYLPFLHAFSSTRPVLRSLTGLFFSLYARHLPRFMADAIRSADLVVVEGGTPLAFLPLIRRLNGDARVLYFCRDLLSTVGASKHLLEIEASWMPKFDSVCVPSRTLGSLLPPGGKVHFVPQAIDRGVFDADYPSPYQPGRINIISIGDMLFDRAATAKLARSVPEATLHLFGVTWKDDVPENVVVYGERGFADIVPYVKHADIGLTAYQADRTEAYLAESSLKLLQYSYCGLPVLMPDNLPVNRGNEIRYSRDGDNDWQTLVRDALELKRSRNLKTDAMTWRDVAISCLATLDPVTQR